MSKLLFQANTGFVLLACLVAGTTRADEGDEEALFQKVMSRLLNSDIVIKDYRAKNGIKAD